MNNDELFDKRQRVAAMSIKPILTDRFLAELIMVARTCGWSVDYVEIGKFLDWCFDVADKPRPDTADLEPFDYDSDST